MTLDSVVKVSSAAAVAWQFTAADHERRERTALGGSRQMHSMLDQAPAGQDLYVLRGILHCD